MVGVFGAVRGEVHSGKSLVPPEVTVEVDAPPLPPQLPLNLGRGGVTRDAPHTNTRTHARTSPDLKEYKMVLPHC